jgi:hypothetical protein
MTVGTASGRSSRAAAWLGFLATVLVVLRLTATGDLATPPLRSLDELTTWADDRGPTASAIAVVRFGAEAATWYLLALSLLHMTASGLRLARARSLAEVLALPGAGRLVRTGLGVGLIASTAVPGDSAAPPREGTATMQPLPDEAPAGTAAMTPLRRPPPEPPGPSIPAPTRWSRASRSGRSPPRHSNSRGVVHPPTPRSIPTGGR